MINYVIGDATQPVGFGSKIITHVVNDIGAWGAGFTAAIEKRWMTPRYFYRGWFKDIAAAVECGANTYFKLGEIQMVSVDPGLWVCNMLAQHCLPTKSHRRVCDLKALASCLSKLSLVARDKQASVHMPRIGCGIGGLWWAEVEPIINLELADCDVTVYDLSAR